MSETTWEDRFWSKVDRSGSCWKWTANILNSGYGQFWRNGGQHLAHRIAYELVNGPIPAGMYIDHKCWTKECVNPDHLRVATPSQNGQNRAGAAANNKHGIRGVNWRPKRRKWRAVVGHLHVGYFDTAAEAEAAAIATRLELFTHNDADRLAS